MNKETLFDIWAPTEVVWSKWAKPVLFAHMRFEPLAAPLLDLDQDTAWAPTVSERCACVLDLPCEQGVYMGLKLASLGYRPVPLYNAIPYPAELTTQFASPWLNPVPVVDVEPIIQALWHACRSLQSCTLPNDAPPAFLLDSNRRIGRMQPIIGSFDNRSVSFPSDFPSANYLIAQGIHRAILIQSTGFQPQPDLAHTLLRWQEGGIVIESKSMFTAGPPTLCIVSRPSQFKAFWYRVLALVGFRRHILGGFGGIIPDPSSAG